MFARLAAAAGTTQLSVTLAEPSDLPGAERVMREVLDSDLGGYRPQWHRELDDLEAAYLHRPRSALLVARHDGESLLVFGTAPREQLELVASSLTTAEVSH